MNLVITLLKTVDSIEQAEQLTQIIKDRLQDHPEVEIIAQTNIRILDD